MAYTSGIQSNIVDGLLKKNPYLSKLSQADRISIYNEAMRQVAEIRSLYYTNIIDLDVSLIMNQEIIPLSIMKKVDNTLIDDLSELSNAERLLIYRMTLSRIGLLRMLQQQSFYTISNVRSLRSIKNIIFSLQSSINIFTYLSGIRTWNFPLKHKIASSLINIKTKTIRFPYLSHLIAFGLEEITRIRFLLSKQIILINEILKTKNITFPLSKNILIYIGDTFKIRTLIFSLSKSIVGIETYQKYKERNYVFPITKTIEVI